MNKKTIALILVLTVSGSHYVCADQSTTKITTPVEEKKSDEVKSVVVQEATAVETEKVVSPAVEQESAQEPAEQKAITPDVQEATPQEITSEEQLTPEEEAFLSQLSEEDFKKLLDELIKLQELEQAAQ